MERKIIWERPVCATVTQQELDERVTVASCSRWYSCPLRYSDNPDEE